MQQLLQQRAAAVEAALADVLQQHFAAAPALIRDAMQYSLLSGGKRIRGALVLESCRLAGGSLADAMPFACAIEMIHAYSLIHDDLPAMDDDDMRRGKPTNHKVYGEAMAILAGDGLLNAAYEIMTQAALQGGENALRAMAQIAAGAGVLGMVGGQCYDIAAAQGQDQGAPVEEIHRLKTGALLRSAILAGLHCAGANDTVLAAMDTYAQAYGVLFQITDDLLDVLGTSEGMGKTVGKDARDDKVTYVSRYGVQGAQQRAKDCCDVCLQALAGMEDTAFFAALATDTLTRQH